MRQWLALWFLTACHSGDTHVVGSPSPGPGASVVASDAAADATVADAAVASCPDRDMELSGPPASRNAFGFPPMTQLCDLPDRIILLDQTTVTVLQRPSLARTRAPISRTEHRGDTCDGPDGGHAGCSISWTRYWSKALGSRDLEIGNNAGNVLSDPRAPDNIMPCRDQESVPRAACSTATRFATVGYASIDDVMRCLHPRLRIADQAGATISLDGEVDATASTGDRWVYRAVGPANEPIELAIDVRARKATLATGDQREDCVAFQLTR